MKSTQLIAISAILLLVCLQGAQAVNHTCNYTCGISNTTRCSLVNPLDVFQRDCFGRARLLQILTKITLQNQNSTAYDYVAGSAQFRHVDFRQGSGLQQYPLAFEFMCAQTNGGSEYYYTSNGSATNCYAGHPDLSNNYTTIKNVPLTVLNYYEIWGFAYDVILAAYGAQKYINHICKFGYPYNDSLHLRNYLLPNTTQWNASGTLGFLGQNYTANGSSLDPSPFRRQLTGTLNSSNYFADLNRDANNFTYGTGPSSTYVAYRNNFFSHLWNFISDDYVLAQVYGAGTFANCPYNSAVNDPYSPFTYNY